MMRQEVRPMSNELCNKYILGMFSTVLCNTALFFFPLVAFLGDVVAQRSGLLILRLKVGAQVVSGGEAGVQQLQNL